MNSNGLNDWPCAYRISVKAMICDDQDRILLIRESGQGWELPGGGLEHNEDPRAGLARELEEEIKAKPIRISQSPISFWTINADKGPRWFGYVLYDVKLDGSPSAGRSGEEGEEIGYFNRDDIDTLKLHENTEPYFMHNYKDWEYQV